MTEEELKVIERSHATREEVRRLVAEIRRLRADLDAAVILMRDLSQDNVTAFETITRCIDAVKAVIPVGGATTETLGTIRECVRSVARLANVSEAEVEEECGEAPVVFDANLGFHGGVADAVTGESLEDHLIVRCCPAQGWYERYVTDDRGVICRSFQIQRIHRAVRITFPAEVQ